ncbi:MAG: ABC transporter permease subunit [Candidatus Bathyarchaeia archaeon]
MSKQSDVNRYVLLRKLVSSIDELSAYSIVRVFIYSVAFVFFVVFVLLPPLIGVLLKIGLVEETLSDPSLVLRARSAVLASIVIAFTVAIFDLLAGIPTAWLIVRRKSGWTSIIDTLADIPIVVPTVALGFSILVFWSQPGGISWIFGVDSLVSPGLGLILLLHFAFSYPIVVRLMVGELQGYDQVYETASRTLGASSLTAARTVTLPILKPAIVSAFLLAFCRSLSETGATVVVAGTFENGPVMISNARAQGQEGPMVLVSTVLIITSCTISALVSLLGPHLRFPIKKVWPRAERKLSGSKATLTRDALLLLVFSLFVALPSLYVALPATSALLDGTVLSAFLGRGMWRPFWSSLAMSYIVGSITALVNMLSGFPLAVIVARRKLGHRLTAILEALISVPITIPSIALGVSLRLFWTSFGDLPEFWVLILVHASITYTYFVKTVSAAIQSVPTELEEVARTLGSRPFGVFRKVIVPLTKYSIFSGAVMVLTRSVDETGATIAVAKEIRTAPVLLVEWIRNPEVYSQSTVGLGILLLVLTAFVLLLIIRLFLRRAHLHA